MDSRANKLAERINGGPDVKGSTEWLKARAQKERDAGRETTAKLLEERAARRTGRIDELNKIKAFATDFKTKYCGGK
jgi:propanediol dehydratase small subunit